MLERSSAELPAVPPTLLREKVIGLATHRSTPPFLFYQRGRSSGPSAYRSTPPTSGGGHRPCTHHQNPPSPTYG